MWKTGDPEMATPKRVRTYRPKHSDTSLSREWRMNMASKKNEWVRAFVLSCVRACAHSLSPKLLCVQTSNWTRLIIA